MSNMSYCRFENTLRDLRDCYHNMNDLPYGSEQPEDDEDGQSVLSQDETEARTSLIALCKRIVEEYGEEGAN
jgi:hypothetical protein